jgi:hypothetical protein
MVDMLIGWKAQQLAIDNGQLVAWGWNRSKERSPATQCFAGWATC